MIQFFLFKKNRLLLCNFVFFYRKEKKVTYFEVQMTKLCLSLKKQLNIYIYIVDLININIIRMLLYSFF